MSNVLRAAVFAALLVPAYAQSSSPAVLVELFTSEGCSDCPPADVVLQHLEAGVPGAQVVVMGEHVTYWDRLGWKDRFSADVFTQRQEAYGHGFRLSSVYTPQMVVNGEAEFVGSDETRARREILKAARQETAKIELKSTPGDTLAISASGLPPQARGADVVLAVTETHLDTDVARGENRGRKLVHTGVVRKLAVVGRVENTSYSTQARYTLDPAWKRENVKLVVFLQDPGSRKIWGTAAVHP
jgi:hypothetical protein